MRFNGAGLARFLRWKINRPGPLIAAVIGCGAVVARSIGARSMRMLERLLGPHTCSGAHACSVGLLARSDCLLGRIACSVACCSVLLRSTTMAFWHSPNWRINRRFPQLPSNNHAMMTERRHRFSMWFVTVRRPHIAPVIPIDHFLLHNQFGVPT